MFFGHCTPQSLYHRFVEYMRDIAPPTARLDYASMPVAPQRFRYTFGTRLAEEGASKLVIAERLSRHGPQNVECCFRPKGCRELRQGVEQFLAPLAQAFEGQIVGDKPTAPTRAHEQSIHGGGGVHRGAGQLCRLKGAGCGFNKPVLATLFPVRGPGDAPHEKVLHRLEADRQKMVLG